jgi:flagellar biogenesis protein FliO
MQLNKKLVVLAMVGFFIAQYANSAPINIRGIAVTSPNQVTLQLDGVVAKGNVNLEFVRDNIQFSLQNSSIYPAKMLHAEDSVFNKIFAYQYSPQLVRIRFTVPGAAENHQGRVQWSQSGNEIIIKFAGSTQTATPQNKTQNNEKQTEKNPTTQVAELAAEQKLLERVIKSSEAQPAAVQLGRTKDLQKESQKESLGNSSEKSTLLAKKPAGPSLGRAFFSMVLVVGGLGLVLFFIKRKKNPLQAHKVSGSKVGNWLTQNFGSLMPNSMRSKKSFIEVMGQHALGPKQSIVVVKIKGQQFVLGVTHDHVQLITQMDSDDYDIENHIDVLDDPAVSASIGTLLNAKVNSRVTQSQTPAFSFDSILRSNQQPAIPQRKANQVYQTASQSRPTVAPSVPVKMNEPGVRDQIKRRLEGMRT